jgi:hypothetical protein
MSELWSVEKGLSCLLEAIEHPDLDRDLTLDLVELETLLVQAAARSSPLPLAA